MTKQTTFTDIEYGNRKRKTKREAFLECMDEIIPWDKVVALIEPYYYKNTRGRKAIAIETMFRMYLLQIWYNLADEALEDAIYDSYAMRKFMHLNFLEDNVPDATTLCKFRKIIVENGIDKLFLSSPLSKHRCNCRCQPTADLLQIIVLQLHFIQFFVGQLHAGLLDELPSLFFARGLIYFVFQFPNEFHDVPPKKSSKFRVQSSKAGGNEEASPISTHFSTRIRIRQKYLMFRRMGI